MATPFPFFSEKKQSQFTYSVLSNGFDVKTFLKLKLLFSVYRIYFLVLLPILKKKPHQFSDAVLVVQTIQLIAEVTETLFFETIFLKYCLYLQLITCLVVF